MEYAALFAGEQPSQLALATSGAARVAHAVGAELSVVRSMCRDWERRALDALLKAAVAEQLSSTLAEACGSRPHQLRRIIEGATVPESAAAFVGAEPTARLAMLEAAAAAPFTFTEEKRIIADFFWHASRKAWRTCHSTTYRVGDIWRDVTLLAPMTCDKVAAQDPRSPPWTLSDVPTKYRARVEAMPPVPTAKVVAFITQAASRFGCLPSRSLRAPAADRQRNLLRWAVAAALCRATNDSVSEAAWLEMREPLSAATAAIATSGLKAMKTETIRQLEDRGDNYWLGLWSMPTAEIVASLLPIDGLSAKT
jgi:hypothetical protein